LIPLILSFFPPQNIISAVRVCFLLSNFPASEFYMPTFRNTVPVPFSQVGRYEEAYSPMKMKETECSETSAYKIQTLGNYPEEGIEHSEQDESLKSSIINIIQEAKFCYHYCYLFSGFN